MGVVFEAQHTRLPRRFAVKLLRGPALDPAVCERFRQEALVASSMGHRNIVQVIDFDVTPEGSTYMVMEYLEGESLASRLARDGHLPLEDTLAIAHQMASALDIAHGRGIVHRDLKPANVFLCQEPDGEQVVKLLDFGISKAREQTATLVTHPFTLIGTPLYMSPEQARREVAQIDRRSDIFAFGVIVFQMLSGSPPFSAASTEELFHKIESQPPPALSSLVAGLPPALDAVLARALAKEPRGRHGSAGALVRDLAAAGRVPPRSPALESDDTLPTVPEPCPGAADRTTLPPAPAIAAWAPVPDARRSIVVLPFANLSADPENEYFSDGLTEELISALCRVAGLRVISRTSAFAFKGKSATLRSIGEQLQVGMVLEGSVRKTEDRLRVSVQLIDVASDDHLWSERYDRELRDVLTLQDEIAQSVAGTLRIKLSEKQQASLGGRRTDDLDAYHLYLRARYHWGKTNALDFPRAVECLRQAIAHDPDYAQAHAALADCYVSLGFFGALAPRHAFPIARTTAARAVALDESLAEAHAALGAARFGEEIDVARGSPSLRRAIELNPSYAFAHQYLAAGLAACGQAKAATQEMRLAMRADPLSPYVRASAGHVAYWLRRFDEAQAHAERALQMDPDLALGHQVLAMTLVQRGEQATALAAAERTEALGGAPWGGPLVGYVLALAGRRQEARAKLEALAEVARGQYVSPCYLAMAWAALGEPTQALEWLERAVEERDHWLLYLAVEPRFDSLRSEPRFAAVVSRVAGLSAD